jgi:ParE toxin of type II toxin-antitoxin system, parDE
MSRVVATETARADLERLIRTHALPPSTRVRVREAIEPLRTFPLLGRALAGRWSGFRVVLGPWPWMLLVYVYDEAEDVLAIVSIQDSRSASAVTSRE